MKKLIIIQPLIFLISILNATIINIPGDFNTIQAGINVAAEGDTVLVADGTYCENLILDKNIVLASHYIIDGDISHRENTIIDGSSAPSGSIYGSCVLFLNGSSRIDYDIRTEFTGFTVRGGKGTTVQKTIDTPDGPQQIPKTVGGGIMILNTYPNVNHNHFKNNGDFSSENRVNSGGAVYGYEGTGIDFDETRDDWSSAIYQVNREDSLNFTNNIFEGNWAESGNSIIIEGYETTIDMSNGFFDVYNSDEEAVSNYWVNSDSSTFDFSSGGGVEALTNDVFVSINGSDDNNYDGSESSPFLTISYAMSLVYGTSENPVVIHLEAGTYSASTNGEQFPLTMVDWVSLVGAGEETTILDGEGNSTILIFENTENSSAEQLTITNGSASYGGGIYCSSSSPSLADVTITNNSTSAGGGIFCDSSSPSLVNVTITNNSSSIGGGICCVGSSPSLANVTITNNSASNGGGGIFCGSSSSPSLANVTITNNSASNGGGGGGISCVGSSPSLANVTISNNLASRGGGIYCYSNSSPSFSSENRCNIYSNNTTSPPTGRTGRGSGADIFADDCPVIDVIVDTFTVMTPTEYHASPIDNFTFDILNAVNPQVDADLYVSPDGDNSNDGLTAETPLKTIQYATSIILADSLNPHTIHLANGIYSPSTNGEFFPVEVINYVSLVGESEEGVILDAEGVAGVMQCRYVTSSTISHLTLTNGSALVGGGIYCYDSNPSLADVTISNNSADWGGGIYCVYSSPSLVNVTITGNSADYVGGGIRCSSSSPTLENVTITGNSASAGGGIYCSSSSPSFSSENRCNIYSNNTTSRECGADIYSSSPITVIVDTFTVMTPTEYHATPLDNFTFDILNAVINTQVDADLYVSPDGDNSNDGLTAETPLKTIQYATSIILADSTNQHMIHLANGIYSPSTNGEFFPVEVINYVSLVGESEEGVILDAEGVAGVMKCNNVTSSTISHLTLTNGSASYGGGIYCDESSPSLENVTITGNSAGIGGGIRCYNSSPSLENVTITDNSASYGGGIYCYYNSSPSLVNCILWNDAPQEVYFYESSSSNSIMIAYSDIQGGEAGIVTNNNGTVYWEDGNIDLDPLFVDAENGDYHLTANSPCIDAGDPDSPLDPDETVADMGAFYFDQSNFYSGPVWHIATTGSDSTGNGSIEYPFASIQHGINTAIDSDSVLVQPGTYVENINYSGKNIVVGSLFLTTQDTTYISETIIDGNQDGSVVTFNSGEDSTAVLSGFTIENGYVTGNSPDGCGGGIYCSNSSPIIRYVTITSNNATNKGGGIYCSSNSYPYIYHTKIMGNIAEYGGGGYFYSSPIIEFVEIQNNVAHSDGGGFVFYGSNDCIIKNVTITNNFANGNDGHGSGGGIKTYSSSLNLDKVTIADNYASNSGGGLFWNYNTDLNLVNSILWNNSPGDVFDGSGSVTYSNIQGGYNGEGNIDADPLFVNPENGNYHLTEDSPCIDAGTAFFVFEGDTLVDMSEDEYVGDAPDMGAFEYGWTETIYGDVDGNGEVQAFDAALALQYSAEFIEFEEWQILAGDVDGNGIVQAYDAALILQYNAGLISEFPVEGGKSANPVDAKINVEKADNKIHISTSDLSGQNVIAFQFDLHHNGDFVDYTLGKITENGQIAINDKKGLLRVSYMNKSPIENSGEIITLEFLNPVKYEIKNFLMNTTKINPNDENNQDFGKFVLGNNYPNPFNSNTTISFSLQNDVNEATIEIFNIKGQKVEEYSILNNQSSITWDASKYSNGIYFYKLTAGDKTFVKKMILMR